MFVRGDWTRRGLGTRILQACEAAAREAGFKTLALMATMPGHALYAHYGFREVERTAITLPDGVVLECVAMEKKVSPQGPPKREASFCRGRKGGSVRPQPR